MKMQLKRYLTLVGMVAGVTLAGQRAQAANLVTDGNFTVYNAVLGASGANLGTNDWPASPWDVSGGGTGNGKQWFWGVDFDDGDPNDPSGNAMAAFKTTSLGMLSQDISTTAGDGYTLTFDYNSGDQGTSEFDVSLTNASDISPSLPSGSAPLSEWETMSYTFQATSTDSDLEFTMYNDNTNTEITAVSVVPVPEPSLLMPLLLSGVLLRRRRSMRPGRERLS